MVTRRRWFRRLLLVLMATVMTSALSVSTHDLTTNDRNAMHPSVLSSLRLVIDSPPVLAQQGGPPTPTTETKSKQQTESSGEASQDQKPHPNTQSQGAEQEKRSLLSEPSILAISCAVLVAVLALLIMLLSPVVGTKDKATLQEKGKFLLDTFPSVLQGVTVLLIVMIVLLLTLVRVVNEQGAISILSALIGYVLGKRATELEYQQSPLIGDNVKPTDLKIIPKVNQVQSGNEVVIDILPPQAVDANIQLDPANTGTARVRDRTAIIYTAATVATATPVKIIATSQDNPSLKSAEATITVLP